MIILNTYGYCGGHLLYGFYTGGLGPDQVKTRPWFSRIDQGIDSSTNSIYQNQIAVRATMDNAHNANYGASTATDHSFGRAPYSLDAFQFALKYLLHYHPSFGNSVVFGMLYAVTNGTQEQSKNNLLATGFKEVLVASKQGGGPCSFLVAARGDIEKILQGVPDSLPRLNIDPIVENRPSSGRF